MKIWWLVPVVLVLQACTSKQETPESITARVNLDLAQADSKFENDAVNRRALALDRHAKLAAFIGDPAYRADFDQGDRDGDLIPDPRDRCPGTPSLTPTDSQGCEYDCNDLSRAKSKLVTREQCAALAPPRQHERYGNADDVAFPINLNCVNAKSPSTSAPLGWASVVLDSGIISTGAYIERSFKIQGLRFFVTRSLEKKPACELFYEFDMRISNGGPEQSTNMLFSAHEDTVPANTDIATFTLRTWRDESERFIAPPPGPMSLSASRSALPLSPGRAKARDSMITGAEIRVRVRAIDGLGHTAGWSEFRNFKAGPDQTK
jgi:hypothetical protein